MLRLRPIDTRSLDNPSNYLWRSKQNKAVLIPLNTLHWFPWLPYPWLFTLGRANVCLLTHMLYELMCKLSILVFPLSLIPAGGKRNSDFYISEMYFVGFS